ncbi:hypothetical protein PUR59_34690 [Streptomyces sp. SP18ES09]|uniref:hypothetical protein n=1 Tax=Streptomyces sp. SP18ES09 TaxID=3002532 RepID=UPI002E7794AE|nr:hypothetical protein [Streptomyces sp. SP18ES09]MEE1820148.1 hypothetical protein [Streptomyces sp. SP18ES09]
MKFQKYRKLKAGVMAVVAAATLVVATAPAEASNCKFGGVTINCDYPVTEYGFSDGALQQFVIGTDSAVWTRWTNPQRTNWSSWESMGGEARSGVRVKQHFTQDSILIGIVGTDGNWWSKYRQPSGTWNAWQRYGVSFP